MEFYIFAPNLDFSFVSEMVLTDYTGNLSGKGGNHIYFAGPVRFGFLHNEPGPPGHVSQEYTLSWVRGRDRILIDMWR